MLAGFDGTVVLHCFSSPALLDAALERRWYVSFAGNVTYPRRPSSGPPPRRCLATASSSRPTARISRRSPYAAGSTSPRTSCRRSPRSPMLAASRRGARPADRRERRRSLRPVSRPRHVLPVAKKHLGQHFLVDENILGVIGRLAGLAPTTSCSRSAPASASSPATSLPGSRTCTPSSSTARSSPSLQGLAADDDPLGGRARPRPAVARAAADQARREPALQHRHAARRREPRPLADDRELVRDGAARGGRPILRRARDEGLRRGLGARAARDRTHRLPSGVARGLPAAAERRVGARRVPAPRRRYPGRA